MDNKETNKYDALKLGVQLCFPLYACAKETVRLYKPYLDELDLTYTQYIAMLALWEHEKLTVKELGKILYLDSGTLTPLLKKLETKGLLKRERSREDERNLFILLTEEGIAMKDKALHIPYEMVKCVELDDEEKVVLYKLLYKLLSYVKQED
ncbi:MAG: MarR family transcriptional regulator [Anaerotignum sp.]|nr:MarR family transcriptional regulator [Anaerotignum sp.]